MAPPLSFLTTSLQLLLALPVAGQSCPLIFDGRVPATFTTAQFDKANAFFQTGAVLGKNLTFATELQLPKKSAATVGLFDAGNAATQPVEVTISDASIFAPSATNVQTGFRRIELLPQGNNGSDATTGPGQRVLHFSLAKDAARPLNLTGHEYQLVFLEDAAFSNTQFTVRAGKLLDTNVTDPDTLFVFGNANNFKSPAAQLFSTNFTAGLVHNFALGLDFDKNTTQVFYSTGTSALKAVTGVLANGLGGKGQFHFGMIKKPVGGGSDPVHNGTQPTGIHEGLVYSGIFIEDGANGCVSLSATAAAANVTGSKSGCPTTGKRRVRRDD